MARAAGAAAIGVAWGYHEPHELIAAGAVGIAENPQDVLRLIGVQEHVDG
jgi:phosphoglycolate phosphatase